MPASRPGSRNATDSPSTASRRERSSSLPAKRGVRATSAMSESACATLGLITVIETVERYQPAPLSSVPPSTSAASAICGAVRLAVPLVRSVAVMSARPASFAGSVSDPARTTSSEVTSGRPRRCATTTRKPLSSVVDSGAAMTSGRGAPGAGGASKGCANAPAEVARRKSAMRAITTCPSLSRRPLAHTRWSPASRRGRTCAARVGRRPRSRP